MGPQEVVRIIVDSRDTVLNNEQMAQLGLNKQIDAPVIQIEEYEVFRSCYGFRSVDMILVYVGFVDVKGDTLLYVNEVDRRRNPCRELEPEQLEKSPTLLAPCTAEVIWRSIGAACEAGWVPGRCCPPGVDGQ